MDLVLSIGLLSISILAIAGLGIRTKGVLGALLVVQAGYWSLGFVVRPLFLIATAPEPLPGDSIADPRLAYPSYSESLPDVLTPALIGLPVYCLAMAVISWAYARRVPAQSQRFGPTISTVPILILLLLGWLLRVGELATQSALLEGLSGLAGVAVGMFILYSRQWMRPAGVGLVVIGELLWSVVEASKTPILAVLLWYVIRLLVERRRAGRYLVLVMVAGLASFLAIQGLKVERGVLRSSDEYGIAYPLWARPLLPVIARFDALRAQSDAWFAGPSSWISPTEAVAQFGTSLVPQGLLMEPKPLVGAQWGFEVRRQSLNVEPGANLAEGPFAEGWVIGGVSGVLIATLAFAGVTVLVAWLLNSTNVFAAAVGVGMTTVPILFERGVLAAGEALGKSLQWALIAAVVLVIVGAASARRDSSGKARMRRVSRQHVHFRS